jgi:arabinose-5-phosphate isomerase
MSQIIKLAKETLQIEWEALKEMQHQIDEAFENVVNGILTSQARLVVTGIGKSGIIAQKWVATFNSTGQKAVFMHAADAIHGDLGMIEKGDWVICISKSGESPEIRYLIPLIKELGNKLVAVSANRDSYLGKSADYCLYTPMEKEACRNNLAPTTSTTLQLAMGDAIAVALMELRDFSSMDFARFHPGGALGKKLTKRVEDLMVHNDHLSVDSDQKFSQVISSVSAGRLGAVVVMEHHQVIGIITDGDIRRKLEKDIDIRTVTARDMMSKHPKFILPGSLAVEAYRAMEENSITQLLVKNSEGEFLGMIHLHDLLREGIF